jgi:hypothetical protein
MSWIQIADDRWLMQDADGTRHLLLRIGGRSVELHGGTVHVYDGPDEVVDEAFPLGVPGSDEHRPTWAATEAREDLSAADLDTAWEALADPRYAAPTAPTAPPRRTRSRPPTAPVEPQPATPSALPGGDEEEEAQP